MLDVPDARLSSLHGLALEIRWDNDVSSLSFVLYFFFLHKKKTQPNEPGCAPLGAAWWEGPAERLAPETPVRTQQRRSPGTRRHWCKATVRGGKKPKKHFCSLTSCPGSQVHTSAWKLRAWKTQNPRHKRFGLHRCKFRSAWQGRCQWLSTVPGRAGLCQSRSAAAQPRDSMTPGLVPRASTARGEAGMPWVKHDVGFTSQ